MSILGALMAVFHTLAAIGRFIRRTPPPPADLLEAYAHEVIPVLDRAEWLYTYWLEQSTLFTDGEKLGNVAAIHRWETATMGRSLERVRPPAVLAGPHEQVIDALELASRATQLLSNGSRFHNANAVCEGQAMLAVSRERRLAALKSMRRYLSRVQLEASPEAVPSSTEMLAEAAALVTAGEPAADVAPDEQALDALPASAEAQIQATGADQAAESNLEATWPEHAAHELIVADEAEPEPSWLSAARAVADQADLPESAPAEPRDTVTAVDGATAPPAVAPTPKPPAPGTPVPERSPRPDGAGDDPPERGGWGSLFARSPEQPDR
jgi:hypothetical protein